MLFLSLSDQVAPYKIGEVLAFNDSKDQRKNLATAKISSQVRLAHREKGVCSWPRESKGVCRGKEVERLRRGEN